MAAMPSDEIRSLTEKVDRVLMGLKDLEAGRDGTRGSSTGGTIMQHARGEYILDQCMDLVIKELKAQFTTPCTVLTAKEKKKAERANMILDKIEMLTAHLDALKLHHDRPKLELRSESQPRVVLSGAALAGVVAVASTIPTVINALHSLSKVFSADVDTNGDSTDEAAVNQLVRKLQDEGYGRPTPEMNAQQKLEALDRIIYSSDLVAGSSSQIERIRMWREELNEDAFFEGCRMWSLVQKRAPYLEIDVSADILESTVARTLLGQSTTLEANVLVLFRYCEGGANGVVSKYGSLFVKPRGGRPPWFVRKYNCSRTTRVISGKKGFPI